MINKSPESPSEGLDGVQRELEEDNAALIERLQIIEEQMAEFQGPLDKLLDLPGWEFSERSTSRQKSPVRRNTFQLGNVRHVTMTDNQLAYIEEFCAKITIGLDNADFKTRRQIIELLDIRGKVAFENNEKVLYLKCLIEPREPQQVLRMLISRSLNIGEIATTLCASHSTVPSR